MHTPQLSMSTISIDCMQENFEENISTSGQPQENGTKNPLDAPDTPSETSSQDGSNEPDDTEAEAKTPFRQWIESKTFTQFKEYPGIEATPRLLVKAPNLFDIDKSAASSTTLSECGEEGNQFEQYILRCTSSSPDLSLLDEHMQYTMTDSDFQRFNEVLVRRIREMEASHKTQMAEIQCKLNELRRELKDKDAEMLFLEERNEVLESALEKIMSRLQHIAISSPTTDLENITKEGASHHSGLEASFIHSTEGPKSSPRFGRDTSSEVFFN